MIQLTKHLFVAGREEIENIEEGKIAWKVDDTGYIELKHLSKATLFFAAKELATALMEERKKK